MTLIEIFAIIIVHWVADFVFQDEKWALGKSKDTWILLKHTSCYSFILFVFGLIFYFPFNFNGISLWLISIFTLITFVTHTITDYFTSRIVSKKFKNNQLGSAIPNFGAFTIIGFDQVLHYIQLFLTYYLLFK